jgi:hypothetical protein
MSDKKDTGKRSFISRVGSGIASGMSAVGDALVAMGEAAEAQWYETAKAYGLDTEQVRPFRIGDSEGRKLTIVKDDEEILTFVLEPKS